MAKYKNKVTGEVFELARYQDAIDAGYSLGIDNLEGITLKDNKGHYHFLPIERTGSDIWERSQWKTKLY